MDPVSSTLTRVNFVHSVITAGDTAYLSYWDLGTVILDISDRTDPEFVSHTTYAAHEEGNAHSAWLAKRGRILIQTDEDFNPDPHPELETAWGYPRIFDISDPNEPKQITTFELPSTRQVPAARPGFFTVHDPKVAGDLLYLSWYAEGVVILDIRTPAQPEMVAQFVPEPHEDPFGLFFPGEEFPNVWGVFVTDDFAMASDINSGLWTFRLNGGGSEG